MARFEGFSARTRYTPVPEAFFTGLMAQIEEAAELKVVLYVFHHLYFKKGSPRFVTRGDLLGDASLVRALGSARPGDTLTSALDSAAEKGILLRLPVEQGGQSETVYFLNTRADQETVEKVKSGEMRLPGIVPASAAPATPPPDIFALYERNIGMITPMIAEDLREAEEHYPAEWIESAFREAVELNKRSWRYIARILERWASQGRGGETRRHPEEGTDKDRYFRGRYGHLVQR